LFLAFTPEITNNNDGNIHNITKEAQPIGAFDLKSYMQAKKFFETITTGNLKWITPEEALLAKLMTNMFSYVQAACANEFYLIAESFGVNIHKILDASGNHNIPNPSINSAGPGMHKEGWFLVDRIPFTDLITTAFKINESMQSQIVRKLENFNLQKVSILGMTSVINSDDPRASLSYKLRKALYYRDYVVGCYDPFLPEYSDSSVLEGSDAVILMTTHDEFKNLEKIKRMVYTPICIYVDINGFWNESREGAINGILQPNEKSLKNKAK
jgi:UDP-N-acetyl-D-mannosaminuronic acid dehydrogenase